ncbi:hypothetical protein [Mycoplasmoides pirum]|uniref:hypothetical protein n=1 Tax=Mycoplasmoides pirum TaxID=2122 RepID=UPI0012DF3A93|nr:hypothetical protein [Mycoplasmoides pirum]
MKKSNRFKIWLYSTLSFFTLGLMLIGLCNLTNNNQISNNLINNNSKEIKTNVEPKPLSTISDIKLTSQNIQNGKVNSEEAIDSSGNYILSASSTDGKTAKVVKLNYNLEYLYEWKYDKSDYKTVQIVADTDDLSYYYVLLVNDNVRVNSSVSNASGSVTTTSVANAMNITITNPAIVVQLYDNGTSFETRNQYNLGLPNFKINNKDNISNSVANQIKITDANASTNIWDHIYVQEAISETDENSRLSFIRNTKTTNSTANVGERTETNVYVNDSSKSVIYALLGTDNKKENNNYQTTSNQNYMYMLTQLYKNNANNMVYIKDAVTNKKMILLFGGNLYQNFWFYDFEVKINNSGIYYVTPLLYANYDFDPFNKKYEGDYMYGKYFDTTRSHQVKKDYYYLPFMKKNKISNLAWYVGGAKTLTLKNQNNNTSNSYIFLAMMQPNVSDFDKTLISSSSSSTSTETIKKATYATPENITSKQSPTGASSGSVTTPRNTNEQNIQSTSSSTQYQNKDVLVGSSSINASFQLFSTQAPAEGNATDYKYPFSAIQSLTVLPVMTSQIASLICVQPLTSSTSIPNEKIYLNTFFENNINVSLNRFSLFNCLYQNNKFYRFDFGQKFFTMPSNWLASMRGPSLSNNRSNDAYAEVGSDDYGFSRILLNKNPMNSSPVSTTSKTIINDGWNNTASQKIVAFSPQITSNVVNTPQGSYNQISAMLIVRGFVYGLTYNFSTVNNTIVPIANTNNMISNFIEPTLTTINGNNTLVKNNFLNLLSISYIDNTWFITYQKDNYSSSYLLKLSKDSENFWDYRPNAYLDSSTKICKTFVLLGGNFLTIEDSSKYVKISNPSHDIKDVSYDNVSNNVDIWGKVNPVSQEKITSSNILLKSADEIANSPQWLEFLIDYQGGWSVDSNTGLPTVTPLFINIKTDGGTISFDVAIPFINGMYYSSVPIQSSKYTNVAQNSALNIPTFQYSGFGLIPPHDIAGIVIGLLLVGMLAGLISVWVVLAKQKKEKLSNLEFLFAKQKFDTPQTSTTQNADSVALNNKKKVFMIGYSEKSKDPSKRSRQFLLTATDRGDGKKSLSIYRLPKSKKIAQFKKEPPKQLT